MGVAAVAAAVMVGGCPANEGPAPLGFANTDDPSNGGAAFAGSASCALCHAEIAAEHAAHGHAAALNAAQGRAPTFSPLGERAGAPDPPAGFDWTDIAYVIGGYRKGAFFVRADGFIATNGVDGVDSNWQLEFTPGGIAAGFAPYLPNALEPTPFAFECFRCHTTGALAQSASEPAFQDGRAGILGTWSEAGVQCEACHGPGGRHFATRDGEVRIDRSAIYVDLTGEQTCRVCHSDGLSDSAKILAEDGFIRHDQQWAELRASGGHADFSCGFCHESHRSSTYERSAAIRNDCTACHADTTMAKHGGAVFVRGDYREEVSCESCHMPFAAKVSSQADAAAVPAPGRVGDTRSHIFRIDLTGGDASQFLSDAGDEVRLGTDGRAALTVDYVCLRCHNDVGLPNLSFTVDRASEIARFMHIELP